MGANGGSTLFALSVVLFVVVVVVRVVMKETKTNDDHDGAAPNESIESARSRARIRAKSKGSWARNLAGRRIFVALLELRNYGRLRSRT